MGTKYIIEVEDKPFELLSEDGLTSEKLFRVKGFNSLVFDWNGLNMLTPYTEPDLEQVRKEAYEDGYENGFIAGHLKAEKSGQSFYEDGYQRGMADANRDGEYNADDGWYVMQKISLLPNPIKTELFGTAETAVILQDNSFKDALDKLTEYEQEQEEIQVGDEVNAPFGKAIVVNVDSVAEKIWFLYADGHVGFDFFKNAPTKTGRHFPEIAEVFEKMKESEELMLKL